MKRVWIRCFFLLTYFGDHLAPPPLFASLVVASGDITKVFEKVMTDRWEDDIQYFNFMESEVLAENCFAEAVGKGSLDETTVLAYVDSQKKLITLREDDSKVEYDLGKTLSRW